MDNKTTDKETILVSACLLGLATRYDGASKKKLNFGKRGEALLIPVCPEQLGGLSTPRSAADIIDGDGFDVIAGRASVVDAEGQDVSANFLKGAAMVLEIAESLNCTKMYLKARSPSCGVTKKIGVTAAMLKRAGISLVEF